MRILIVDDDPVILRFLQIQYQKKYPDDEIHCSLDGMQSLLTIQSGRLVPDIIIIDFMMPTLNGFEFSKRVKDWADKNNLFVYIIMISANTSRDTQINAFAVVDDFIYKPLDLDILFLRTNIAQRTLRIIQEKNSLIQKNNRFFKNLEESNEKNEGSINRLSATIDQFLLSFSELIEFKDHQNIKHTMRVGEMSRAIGKELKLTELLDTLKYSGFLHDIGKIGIPDALLRKPGPLTQDERAVIRTHPEIGVQIIQNMDFFKDSFAAVLHHHERWDGEGYPARLSKECIPITARIVSVAEVFDVLMYSNPYSEARSKEESYEEILKNRGSQFDPQVVDAFSKIYHRGEIQAIYQESQK